VPLNNINLSEIVWIKIFKTGMPSFWLFREIFGIGLVLLYMGLLPPILSKTLPSGGRNCIRPLQPSQGGVGRRWAPFRSRPVLPLP